MTQRKVKRRGGGSCFVIPFWCDVFGLTAGLSSGLLLVAADDDDVLIMQP